MLNLMKKISDAGGFKVRGCPTWAKAYFLFGLGITSTTPLLAQSYLPNMAPSTYHPTNPIERREKFPNYYDPNRDKLPYYDPNNPATTTYRPGQGSYNGKSFDANNPAPFSSSNDGQQISLLIQSFLKGIQEGNLEGVYQVDTHSFFRNASSFEQFKYFVNTHQALTKSKAIFLGGSDVQGDTAIVTLNITNLNNVTEVFDFYLLRETGTWKILGILTDDLKEPPEAKPAPIIRR